MEHKFKLILMLAIASVVSFSATARKELKEDDIPLNVLSYFYQNYDKPEDISWSMKERNGEEHYQASFKQGDQLIVSLYNLAGEIQEESALTEKPNLPGQLATYAKTNFVGSKVVSLRKITKFSHVGTMDKEIYFELICKTESKELVSAWFDNDLQVQQGDQDFSTLARN